MTSKPHFSLLATSFAGGPRPRSTAIILFGLWFLLFFAALFTPPILDDADGTHAQAAQAMASTGDLITLRVDGVRYLEKPPLPYWLAALCFRLFGFNSFAAHLPQALAVLLLMLLGYRWANQAFGARTAYYTGLGVLTSAGVFLFTRVLIPEALLSLCLAASLFAFLKALGPVALEGEPGTASFERPSKVWYAGPLFYPYVMWGSLALAVLAKGLVALVFFFTATLLFLMLTGELKLWRKLCPGSGIVLFLVLAAPWHLLAAIRNPGGATGGMAGHGFLWLYFVNEHVLRFLGRRIPMDYNEVPTYLFYALHLVWLFPWILFLPLGFGAISRRVQHQTQVITANLGQVRWRPILLYVIGSGMLVSWLGHLYPAYDAQIRSLQVIGLAGYFSVFVAYRRWRMKLELSPFHRIDPQQRTLLLLSLFAVLVLLFFSLSTNQEYYTFPAYLPILLLLAATITRAEQTFSTDPSSRRWIGAAHLLFTTLGALIALSLLIGLWASRNLSDVVDIGTLLAHRGVGAYTLSMSSIFDLTFAAFAALRLPAALAAAAFALGPSLAGLLRMQRRHLAATSAIAFTMALFLVAAHLAFARFAPILSSEYFAANILALQGRNRIEHNTEVLLFGDQAYGSSLAFYLGRPVKLVDARTSSMYFGSTFPDAPPVFLTGTQLRESWGHGPRKIVFVPIETRPAFEALLGKDQTTIAEQSGKLLVTDRPME